MTTYKEEQEQFVSGHNGTTATEVAVLTLAPSACVLIRNVLVIIFGLQRMPFWPKVVLDYSIIIVPSILHVTVLSHLTTAVCVTLYASAAAICLLSMKRKSIINLSDSFYSLLHMETVSQRPFLTNMRSLVNIGTSLVILAVDFPIFPRRFAKTETFGIGFMDNGVGCFVVSNALVCPEARGKLGPCRSIRECIHRVLISIKSSLPLIFLGLCRLLAVKGTDYHEHVTEYGIHWNFFFTLAIVKVFSTLILSICPIRWSWLPAFAVIGLYQYALSHMSLSEYILHGSDRSDSRESIIDANREGICSCLGYIALFLVGAQIGFFIFCKKERKIIDWIYCLLVLVMLSGLCYGGLQATSSLIQPVSRRMANLSFVLWIVALSSQVLASCLFTDLVSTLIAVLKFVDEKKLEEIPKTEADVVTHFSQKKDSSDFMSAVNFNGLLYFLLSNLFTGFVNMTVYTLHISAWSAVAILQVYLFVLCIIIMSLHRKNMGTRFW